MRRALAAAVIAVVALTGCGNTDAGSNGAAGSGPEETTAATPTPSEESTEDDQPGETPSESDEEAIEVEIEGDRIKPNGKLVEVGVGETVTLEVDSDRAGSLHVHSTPEHELSFGKGTTTVELTIDRPGLVDVEEHEAGVVVLQLEVR